MHWILHISEYHHSDPYHINFETRLFSGVKLSYLTALHASKLDVCIFSPSWQIDMVLFKPWWFFSICKCNNWQIIFFFFLEEIYLYVSNSY